MTGQQLDQAIADLTAATPQRQGTPKFRVVVNEQITAQPDRPLQIFDLGKKLIELKRETTT
jgi:hypothetical protein